ncbi:MAG: PEP-CTERM sorting domain-containing protein [Bryobacteraceae bacterium]
MFRLALAVTLTSGLASAAVLIDNFNTTQNLLASGVTNPVTDSSGVATAGTSIGDSRFASITRTVGGGTASLDINSPTAGVFSVSNNNGVVSDPFVLWDGGIDGTISPTGLTGPAADLTGGGANNALRFVSSVDLSGAAVTFRFYTGSLGQFSEITQSLTGGGANLEYLLPFAAFTATGGGADFANVGAITMGITGPAGVDLQMDLVETTNSIPEPATLGLVGAALIGLAYIRRKTA